MMDSHETNEPLKGDLEEVKKTAETEEISTSENTQDLADLTIQKQETTVEEEEQTTEDTTPETIATDETDLQPAPTKKDILEKLKSLDAEKAGKQELDNLKQSFYKLHNAELEAKKEIFMGEGGKEEDFFPMPDDVEVEFKGILTKIREKRNRIAENIEKKKEENLAIKLTLIDKLRELVESPEDTNKSYHEFKNLQQRWNEIKLVPQSKVNELWKSYQYYVEKFYDILKLNNEFRDYDFKKNLEIKTKLIEAVERLVDEPDAVSAFYQLQKLHQEFRDTGPVSKDLREQVWSRFKVASSVINRSYQQHFEKIKENEQLNLVQKIVICEIVEAIEFDELNSLSAWDAKTKEVIALQKKWKTIGFAPHKLNNKVFDRFRKACDNFFDKKAEYFKAHRNQMAENLEKKKALCEKAEELKDSTDWKATADIFVKLQKEWKSIGPTQKKHSDSIWKRFISACDYFFEQKNQATYSQRYAELDNLKKKKSILEQLEAIDDSMEIEEAKELVHELMKEWNTIGHVPFRDKDKLYKQYHANIDRLFDLFNISMPKRKSGNPKSNTGDKGNPQSPYKEREKLMRAHESMKAELQTYENNIGFLSASSKKGNSLLTEIERKVGKLKTDLEIVSQKLKVIDDSIREEQDKEE